MNFWNDLKKPFFVLAPMEDVTDTVFRRVIASCGRPDAMFTEFTNCEGIQSVGQSYVIHRLKYSKSERPLVAQVWGITPEDYFKTAKLIVELGFDGLDINMGCPVKNVIKQGACSALIKNPSLAKEIVVATKEGLAGKIPLSIKTRIGFTEIATEKWCGFLLQECMPDALTVHGRTVKELSDVPNHWDEIGKVVEIRNSLGKKTKVIGNGDIASLQEANKKIAKYKLDGIMIGRGVFKNPWMFNSNIDIKSVTIQERIMLLLKHVELFEQTWGREKNYMMLAKYYKIYIHGFVGASDLRVKLNDITITFHKDKTTNDLVSVIAEVCNGYLKHLV